MSEYKLHCFAQSGHSYKAALMLQLSGADWSPVWVDFFNGASRSDAFRGDLNVMGEAPVLEHGALTLTQSGVILDYLAENFPTYAPQTPAEKREALRWILWENHKLNSYLGTWRFFENFAPEKIRNADVEGFLKGRALAAVKVLAEHLSDRDWIASDRPTTADIACSGYLFYPIEEYPGLSIPPAIAAWQDRMRALPNWAAPYDLMPGYPFGTKPEGTA